MGVLVDLIGSMIIGGALLLIVLDANNNALEVQQKYAGDAQVQEGLTGIVQVLESEFRNIGFGLADTAVNILSADTASMTFLTCLDGSGTHIDTLHYWLGSASEMTSTQNELDRPLYRSQNSQAKACVGVVTLFALRYIDYQKNTIPTPVVSTSLKSIQEIEITVEVQNPFAQYRDQPMVQSGQRSALYSNSLWQQTRLASQNFKR
jgi:hypothetical protein